MPGLLGEESLTRVFNAWRRSLRRDPVTSRLPLPDLLPLCDAFNGALGGDDDQQLKAQCQELASGDLGAAAVVSITTRLAETVVDEVDTSSGAVVRSLVTTLGDVCAMLTVQMVDAAAVEARRDYLTGLENRLAWDEGLATALRERAALCLCIIDLDGLKVINDRDGHEAGDAYLQDFAAALRSHTPEGARAYRFGGDEYAVIFTRIGRPLAAEAMEALAATPGVAPFSYGLAAYPDDASSAAKLKQTADQAMYIMKRARKEAGSNMS